MNRMELIDKFVDSVFHRTNTKKKEINELKMEMKKHLYDVTTELVDEGYNEIEAQEIAIDRFGGSHTLQKIVDEVYVEQKTFGKWTLWTGIGIVIFSIILYFVLFKISEDMVLKQSVVGNHILELIKDHETITAEKKTEINDLVKINPYKNIEIYKLYESTSGEMFKDTNPSFSYQGNKSFPETVLLSNFHIQQSAYNWAVQMEISHYHTLSKIILLIGFIMYWLLFSIWGIVNAHHNQSTPWLWGIIFFSFNLVGYIFYLIIHKVRKY